MVWLNYGTPRTAFPNASTPQRRVLGPSWAWAVKTIRSRFPTRSRRRGQGWHGARLPLGRRSVISRWREYPRRDDATPRVTLSSHSGRLTRSPPLEFLLPAAILLPRRRPTTQVSKHDFDMAVKNAQEALRAKTSSSQAMLQQASSAMRNAVTALSLSEQEVANLRQSVEELKQQQRDAPGRAGGGDGPATDRERAQLRAPGASRRALPEFPRVAERSRGTGTSRTARRCPWRGVSLRIDPMLGPRWCASRNSHARVQLRRRRKRRRVRVNDTVARWSGSRRDAW